MLSRLFFVINFFIITIVFSLKTYYQTSVDWFYSLPWLTFLNGFIDIAIKSKVDSNYILTFWFVTTIIWLIFLIKEIYFKKFNYKHKQDGNKNKPLDIDQLNDVNVNNPTSNKDESKEKIMNNPESVGVNFAAALSQAVSKNSETNETSNSNSGFFDQANQALSSMTPDAAKKLKRVQSVLNDLEATTKIDDPQETNKKDL